MSSISIYIGLLQLHMVISFPFLRAEDLRRFLLIMRTRGFFTLLYVEGTYERLVYTWYKNIFRMIAVLIFSLAVNRKKGIWWKKYQNETATRQRQDSVTVSGTIARKINTLSSFPIHWGRPQSAAASVVVYDTLDASHILRWNLRCFLLL